MRAVWVIAMNTLRENLRDKILAYLLGFALCLLGLSVLLGHLSLAEQAKIITDLGLAAINLVGVIIAIFVGISLVSKEVEGRTIYTLLARPISRTQVIVGKYLGLVVTLWVNVVVMTTGFLGVLWLNHSPIHWALVQAVELIFIELVVLVALALLFSTFSTTALSTAMSLGLYIIGHLTGDLREIAVGSRDALLQAVMTGLYYVLPNLEVLNIKGQAAYGTPVSLPYQALATGYGILYAGACLAAACLIFNQRDL